MKKHPCDFAVQKDCSDILKPTFPSINENTNRGIDVDLYSDALKGKLKSRLYHTIKDDVFDLNILTWVQVETQLSLGRCKWTGMQLIK